ncbi:MAG: VOC family protein [Actinobacteria bacterium]|nr:VOC family protein [Actinomycetota bacterium]
MSGKVVHFEVPVDDVDRATSFYVEAFGWQLASMPGMGYTMITTTPTDEQGRPAEPGAINGGMFVREADLTTPMITIDVADLDAALAKVEELGGSVVRPKFPVGDMGFAGYFRDSEGNLLGLWQSAT